MLKEMADIATKISSVSLPLKLTGTINLARRLQNPSTYS